MKENKTTDREFILIGMDDYFGDNQPKIRTRFSSLKELILTQVFGSVEDAIEECKEDGTVPIEVALPMFLEGSGEGDENYLLLCRDGIEIIPLGKKNIWKYL